LASPLKKTHTNRILFSRQCLLPPQCLTQSFFLLCCNLSARLPRPNQSRISLKYSAVLRLCLMLSRHSIRHCSWMFRLGLEQLSQAKHLPKMVPNSRRVDLIFSGTAMIPTFSIQGTTSGSTTATKFVILMVEILSNNSKATKSVGRPRCT